MSDQPSDPLKETLDQLANLMRDIGAADEARSTAQDTYLSQVGDNIARLDVKMGQMNGTLNDIKTMLENRLAEEDRIREQAEPV